MHIYTQEEVPWKGPGRGLDSGGRWFGLWDGYFAVSYLVTVVLLFASGEDQVHRALAIGALTLIVPWYAGLGRRPMIDRTKGRRNLVFSAGLFLLFATSSTLDLGGSFALFAVVPMLMMSLPMPPAIVLVVLANLWPVTVVWLRGGEFDPHILSVLPISLLGIALSVLLGLWITRVVQQSSERAEMIDELRRSREREAHLSHQAGISAERERLAREIHDTLAQSLTSIISLVQAAESEVVDNPARAHERLGLAGRVARDSLAEARGFVSKLTPPALRESSLVQAVRRQADLLREETGLVVRCTAGGEEQPLPMVVSVVLLRAAQEAFANVRKHARDAREVEVRVAYAPGEVRLVVRDDGAGFAVDACRDAGPEEAGDDAHSGGFGLLGMRARVAEIGGTVRVESGPGEGTTVEVTVALGPVGEESDDD
ncbi:sensor histidine kinase [Streptomyces lavendulae]|uniref:sensor histidine kinase n=1 Tax=Streptomyces lavendulae TaxID=1914 RepID=UPI0024A57ADF|nr:sensor histidine kinase [Streptomyces lavendulae]GLW02311.1 two-component sensor histidine kinase [Streptomyces lavendulae subsp. lavendulae]